MNGLFVTGTDTDVGKTALSALLLGELQQRGIHACPMKPAQTGCIGNVPDLDYSLSMSAMSVDSEVYKTMAPYTFEPACSPHLAANLAGVKIELAEMINAAEKLQDTYEFLLIEGAGGIMVPLNEQEMMLDLMKAMNLPVLLAARPGLGTINHTLLSIRALRAEGLVIKGVVFVNSSPTEPGFIEKDNVGTIEHFGSIPVLGTIPFCSELATENPVYTLLPEPIISEAGNIVDKLSI